MKLDKQTENNAQLFFRNVIEETGFIDALLLESFFADDAKRLTQDWLSIDLKFMKNDEEDRGYWPDPETYDHEPWPLQQFIEQHKKRKKRKTAA